MELYESFNVVVPVASAGLAITSPSTLTSATEGSPYAYTMSAIGGQPPYSWSILSFQKQGSTTYKFNPGQGALSDSRIKTNKTTSDPLIQNEINYLSQSGTAGAWAGSPFTLYQATYMWGALEGSTLGNYSGIQGMMQDFLYLQSKCPGCRFAPGIIWFQYPGTAITPATINATVSSPAIPAYVYASPSTYGVGSNGSQGGYGLSAWNGSAWTIITAAMWNANVRARLQALIQAIASTVVPDGSGLTVDNHPLFEMVQDVTEYSFDLVSGTGTPNPTYVRANFDTQYQTYLTGMGAYLTKTQFAPYAASYGLSPGGSASYAGLQSQIFAAAPTTGLCLSDADTYDQTYRDITWGQHLFNGDTSSNFGATWTLGGGTDYRNVSGYCAVVQSPDYAPANGVGANYPAVLAAIYATATQLKSRYIMWCMQDENSSFGYSFFNTYVTPFVKSNQAVTTTRPTNLP